MNLSIIRGTTNTLSLTIEDENGELYKLKDSEKIIFGVKSNAENSDYDICKIATEAVDSTYIINITPEDTAGYPFGRYYFDVGLQTADGNYYMVIPCSEFYIKKAVTSKEIVQ
jgi:hypothetical protein